MAIYTSFGKQNTVKEFLKEFFSSYSSPYYLNIVTYKDPECSIIQCYPNKYRSFDDVLECVKTYYPDISPKDLMHELLTLNIKNTDKKYYLHVGTCSGIRRIRMLFYPDNETEAYMNMNSTQKYDSIYSWKELFSMLGLYTIQDVKNYVKKHIQNETV